jgi:hypothetical protein
MSQAFGIMDSTMKSRRQEGGMMANKLHNRAAPPEVRASAVGSPPVTFDPDWAERILIAEQVSTDSNNQPKPSVTVGPIASDRAW